MNNYEQICIMYKYILCVTFLLYPEILQFCLYFWPAFFILKEKWKYSYGITFLSVFMRVCMCILHNNIWKLEAVFIKLTMNIMTSEPLLTASFIKPFITNNSITGSQIAEAKPYHFLNACTIFTKSLSITCHMKPPQSCTSLIPFVININTTARNRSLQSTYCNNC